MNANSYGGRLRRVILGLRLHLQEALLAELAEVRLQFRTGEAGSDTIGIRECVL